MRRTRVSGETARTVSATAFTSDRTPVEVSTCVTVTSLYDFAFSAFSTSITFTAAPTSAVSWSTLAPKVERLQEAEHFSAAIT